MNSFLHIRRFSLSIMFLCSVMALSAQEIPDSLSNINNSLSTQTIPFQDSIPTKTLSDSTFIDSIPISLDSLLLTPNDLDVMISDDALEDEVSYSAEDTIVMDYQSRIVYLYGGAQVSYKTLILKADFIRVNLDSSMATATGFPDSLGNLAGFPEFEDGDQSFTAHKMKYNFKSQKGMVYDVVSEQGDLRILGAKTKFVSGGSDSLHLEDVIYNTGAIITTCKHAVPHYGIRAAKIKTIPNKLVVVGASNLELLGVPTPLWLPFGFYPATPKNKAAAGLIFPQDYEYSNQWGFGLRNVGYYFPIKNWADMRVTGDIYFNGSYGLNVASNYVKKYKFRGNVGLGFSKRITEATNSYSRNKTSSFSIRVSHNQDSKAHPYQRIGGSINIQSNDFQSLNQNDYQSAVTSSYSSNFSYNRTFPDKPYTLNVGFSHSQNTRNNSVTINFPTVDFKVNRIYPFKKKNGVGSEKWFEKISFRYDVNAKSTFTATDSTIFSQKTLDDAQFGLQHKASTDFNFDIFKYIHVTPSINYSETWFFKELERDFIWDENDTNFVRELEEFDPNFPDNPQFIKDTVDYGDIEDSFVGAFNPFRTFNTSVSVNTQLFFTKTSSKGWLRGFRHIIKPSISYTYSPATYSENYFKDYRSDIRQSESELDSFSIFTRGLYSVNVNQQERQSLSFSFNNIFEAKYWSKKDSVAKKLKLFDNIYVSGNYNFAADSFRMSQIGIRGTTRFFKKLTTFSFMTTYDPYGLKENGRRSQEYFYSTDRKLLRFQSLQLRFNTSASIKRFKEIFQSDKKKEDLKAKAKNKDDSRGGLLTGVEDSFGEIFDNFSVNHSLLIRRMGREGKDTTIVSTHTASIRGSMKLTPNWAITVGNIGYNFKTKNLTYPDIGFTRDLHCWQLSFNWQPTRGTYSMYIGVKPGSLDFLKVPHRRNNVDSFGGF